MLSRQQGNLFWDCPTGREKDKVDSEGYTIKKWANEVYQLDLIKLLSCAIHPLKLLAAHQVPVESQCKVHFARYLTHFNLPDQWDSSTSPSRVVQLKNPAQ